MWLFGNPELVQSTKSSQVHHISSKMLQILPGGFESKSSWRTLRKDVNDVQDIIIIYLQVLSTHIPGCENYDCQWQQTQSKSEDAFLMYFILPWVLGWVRSLCLVSQLHQQMVHVMFKGIVAMNNSSLTLLFLLLSAIKARLFSSKVLISSLTS